MKRREFLLSGVGAVTGSLLAARTGLACVSPQSRKVIVIGAGLSGLVAAYELSKLNFDVRVLEAQSRPGGRVFTLRNFDEPGLHAEAGAARLAIAPLVRRNGQRRHRGTETQRTPPSGEPCDA